MKSHMRNAIARVAKYGAPGPKAKAKARLKKPVPAEQKVDGAAPRFRLDKAPRKAAGGPMSRPGGPPQMLGPPIMQPPAGARMAEGGGLMGKIPRAVTDFADDVKQTWKGHMTPEEQGKVKGYSVGVGSAIIGAEALRLIGDALKPKTGKDMTGATKEINELKTRGKKGP